ncbi:plasmid mobilization relaxosome protein MobC [Vagococcus fluvialis]|uniref:plasmid mobilization protein n=1 Tax=Vagococcus TaxID=2737 RepID=UPI001A9011A0|nr:MULTISPECIES: plasmid mobilization relaxosome protein MobC [Vagococcus]MBO0480289.1 plasmid mobilization relaxosome protein MobC [Vagococcus fluvialis]MBO0484155.1 plasmid mobilization relaxosome protein MobC [Vagococcus fluvialis]MDT2832238.1 plasmid mobilization relaxosome protein MobC [Vagococcus carniphilus]MDT2841013.1 plasmid mobilization relaxosome protein MobC [Vagococcus carniphilus]MDT2855746.1 plasmid mobilization relaxosome protein MobC [Vagococcus carniphilus]
MEKNGRRRTNRKEITFTDQELAYVMEKVEAGKFKNFQAFALHMLITGEVTYNDYSELIQLKSEVHRIGNNLNQLTKMAYHSYEISSEDIQELNQTFKEIQSLMTDTFKAEIKTNKIRSEKKEIDYAGIVKSLQETFN